MTGERTEIQHLSAWLPRALGLLLAALLLLPPILLTTAAAAAAAVPIGDPYVSPAQLAEFQAQGHSPSDIYTARTLEEQTGVPIQRWLDGRKQGKDFPTLINELAPGQKLERRRYSTSGRSLTESEIRTLVDEGYSGSDILSAGEVVHVYGGDPRAYLQRHAAGESWSSIMEAEGRKWRQEQEQRAKENPDIRFGKDGTAETTVSGLTKEEIRAFLKQGYTLGEILGADSRAHALGLHIRDVAKEKQPNQTWEEAIAAAWERANPGSCINCKRLVYTEAGLTDPEVEALLAAGETTDTIRAADSRATTLVIDLRLAIAGKQEGETLEAAVERFHTERTPAERAAALRARPNEAWRIRYYAKETGRTEAEVRELRAQQKSWIEISGYRPPAGQKTQFDIADSYGISDHILVERATDLGYSVWDVRQAGILARTLSMPVEDVLAHKTRQNTWDDVLRTLSPLPAGGPDQKPAKQPAPAPAKAPADTGQQSGRKGPLH